jgi:cysteine synthase A
MQQSGLGGEIRLVLRNITGQPTIPQIFVAGRSLGGAMDLISLHDRGELLPMLDSAGIAVAGNRRLAARSYLPSWLASRVA